MNIVGLWSDISAIYDRAARSEGAKSVSAFWNDCVLLYRYRRRMYSAYNMQIGIFIHFLYEISNVTQGR